MKYTIRLATATDIPLLAPLELASAVRVSEEDLPMRFDYTVPTEFHEQALERKTLWVAELDDNTVIGYCLLREIHGLALLFQLDVLPQYGQQGIGRALVMRAISRARELGYDYIYLTTFQHLAWNAPFYAKLGFAEMPDSQLPAPVLAILNEERAIIAKRVAMGKSL